MMRRRYASYTNRSLEVFRIIPGIVAEQRPTLSTVSIMPGMDWRAPLRTLTRRGSSGSPYRAPMTSAMWARARSTSSLRVSGYRPPWL